MLALPALERQSAGLSLKVPDEYAQALEIVPRDALLGYNVHNNGFIYPLYRADYSQRLVYVPILEDSTCLSIAEAIEARGTRYLFVAPEHTEDWILSLLNQCATEKDVLRERVRGLYVVKRDKSSGSVAGARRQARRDGVVRQAAARLLGCGAQGAGPNSP